MKPHSGRGLLAAGVLVLSASLTLSLSPTGAAQAASPNGPSLRTPTNGPATAGPQGYRFIKKRAATQLFVSAPYRHTRVHLMPTTTWVRNHTTLVSPSTYGPGAKRATPDAAPAVRSMTATSASDPLALPSPVCTLAEDASPNDAHVLVNLSTNQYNSLDISGVGLYTDGSTITAKIRVQSLTDGSPAGTPSVPAVAGSQDEWYVVFTSTVNGQTNRYFLGADYPGTSGNVDSSSGLPFDFTYGSVTKSATGGDFYGGYGEATNKSSSVDLKNGIITITAPLNAWQTAPAGSSPLPTPITPLASTFASSWALVGAPGVGGLIERADQSNAGPNYAIGQTGSNCPDLHAPPLPTQGVSANLAHYGGPVVHTVKNYLIFWLPNTTNTTTNNGDHPGPGGTGDSGIPCAAPATKTYNYEPPGVTPGTDSTYEQILEQYFKDLPGTSFYNLLTQYADESKGAVNNNPSFGGVYIDTCGYSSTPSTTAGPVPGGTAANPIYDLDVQNEVLAAMKANGWKPGLGNEYFVYTGYEAASCFGPPSPNSPKPGCSVQGPVPGYCAYHGDFNGPNNTPILYANMADGGFAGTAQVGQCYLAPIGTSAAPKHTVTVNGQQQTLTDYVADAEVAITSHEQFETVSDAMIGSDNALGGGLGPPLGWYDAAAGEIGDKCAYIYGNYNPTDGANITLRNGDRYIVQLEYSNWANGCSLGDPTVAAGPYGGVSDAVTIEKGWNLIADPASGASSVNGLVSDMTRPGQLPAGSVQEVATFHNGAWSIAIPGVSADQPLNRTDGLFVLTSVGTSSGSPVTWTPSGAPYTSPASITFNHGWNLVAPTWPNPGLMTDSMFNQIEAENRACSADSSFTNASCDPTVSAIDAYATGHYLDWSPAGDDGNGDATWPQPYGNQIPFTNGMWVQSSRALSWTPQGTECQQIVAGMCQ